MRKKELTQRGDKRGDYATHSEGVENGQGRTFNLFLESRIADWHFALFGHFFESIFRHGLMVLVANGHVLQNDEKVKTREAIEGD